MTDDWRWQHLIATTYGAWLHGDARGFRTRHHREHVEGDYKNPPPPGMYEAREKRSRESLKQPPVVIPPALREVVGRAILDKLALLGATVVCLTVAGQHVHVLAKVPVRSGRHWMGIAKKHTWFVLRERGWGGKLWGKRGRVVPVKDRAHQLNVYHYILRHAEQKAWVWKWGQA